MSSLHTSPPLVEASNPLKRELVSIGARFNIGEIGFGLDHGLRHRI